MRKLCYRSLLPKHLPDEAEWTGLHSLQGESLTQLSSRDFLNRLKLKGDLDAACRARAKREADDPQSVYTDSEAAVEAIKEEFASRARSYLVRLLERFLDDISFNSDIVKGMSCFDPVVLLSVSFDQAALCFSTLYYSFSLRGWVSNTPETEARDEYLEFVDFFRTKYHDFKDVPETFTDMIGLLTPMPELRSRRHLFHLFQLSCLCLTSQIPKLPAIKFQGVNSSDPRCRLSSVLLPAQSYLANVVGSVAVCTTEAYLEKYRELESRFISGNVAGDPWVHIDSFGKANFLKTLISAQKALKDKPRSASRSPSSSVSSTGCQRRNRSPIKDKKGVKFGAVSFSKAPTANDTLLPGSSKDYMYIEYICFIFCQLVFIILSRLLKFLEFICSIS